MADTERQERIQRVRDILKRHEIKASVRGGKGTSYGFIYVRPRGDEFSAEEKRRLRALFGYGPGRSGYTFNPWHPDYGRREWERLAYMDSFLKQGEKREPQRRTPKRRR